IIYLYKKEAGSGVSMKNFRLFPKQFGFIPHIFLIYLVMPLYQVNQEEGWKAVIGYSLLLLFFISYRQCYQPIPLTKFYAWMAVQVAVTVIFVSYYDPFSIFLGFYTSNFIGWINDKKKFNGAWGIFAGIMFLCAGWIWFQYGFSNLLSLAP